MDSDTLALLPPHVDSKDVVFIEIEGGKPLGIFMEEKLNNAVIKEFKRESDQVGPIEQLPDIHVGAVLVAINGKNVTGRGLREVGEMLKKLKDRAKVLGWRVERKLASIDLGPPVPANVAPPAIVAAPVRAPIASPRTVAPISTDSVAINVANPASPRSPHGLSSPTGETTPALDAILKLPDGSDGAVELHGGVRPGALLVRINGQDVDLFSLDEVKTRLGELADQERTLEFQPPRRRAHSQDYDLRRKEEFTLMKLNDATKIERGECWMVVDAKWVERWVTFAALNGPPPGPINNEVLVQDGWLERMEGKLPGDADLPREGLKVSVDYRCVTPLVWCFFTALHGTSKMPPIARYAMDIYGRQLPAMELKKILKGPLLKAEIKIKDIKQRCQYGAN
ncbi:Aste57867_13847 [Aphanomyces stellatus]|uniref:Aste57867_13847 protein n=1 Tax=Aphanomyces stellatus TaxID=120398 RepID=A0A485L0V2_9STRA|nr:hypothetical protein As57867_013796 [Aphanomyces stellatus]VFT90678.1 Aste57867_13847 [Aphanomyces stellatus]